MTNYDSRMNAIIQSVVSRLVSQLSPLRIMIFGSVAREEHRPDSDLDLLMIMPDGTNRRKTAKLASRILYDIGIPKDIVVVTESDVLNYSDNMSYVLAPALREGIEIYHA